MAWYEVINNQYNSGGGYIPDELVIFTSEYTESDLPETENG